MAPTFSLGGAATAEIPPYNREKNRAIPSYASQFNDRLAMIRWDSSILLLIIRQHLVRASLQLMSHKLLSKIIKSLCI
jgi:hypothetical protein